MLRRDFTGGFAKLTTIIIVAVPIAVAAYITLYAPFFPPTKYWFHAPKDFEECTKARGEVFFSMPPKCRFHGREFTNDAPMIQKDEVKDAGASASSEVIDVSDWKTYRNEEYGFEVKYPEDFDMRVASDILQHIQHKVKKLNAVEISVLQKELGKYQSEDVALDNVASFRPFMDDYYKRVLPKSIGDQSKFFSKQNTLFNGYEAVIIQDDRSAEGIPNDLSYGVESKNIYVYNNHLIFHLTPVYSSEYKKVINQILSTFKFTR
jgi:hypothetical protein